jgi:hypothetical protein
MAILTKGAAEAAAIAEAEKAARGSFYRVPDFRMKDGDDPAFLRMVTDLRDLTTFSVHRFMPTKPKPEECDWDKWPETMWGVCQDDNAFRIRDSAGNLTPDFEDGYGDCYLSKTYAGRIEGKFNRDMGKPDAVTYGLAVVRVPVYVNGNVTGFRDELVEYKGQDGKITKLPKFVVVGQKYSNFFHPMAATAFVGNSVLAKEFLVSRKGNDYTITSVADDPSPDVQARYQEALALTGFNLDAYLLDHATPDHYAKFFIPGQVPEGGYSRKGNDDDGEEAAADQAAAPADGPVIDQSALAAFGDRLSKRGTSK